MPQPYLFISFTALLLTPSTRKRPPQSGSVQTGMWEITPAKSAYRLRSRSEERCQRVAFAMRVYGE